MHYLHKRHRSLNTTSRNCSFCCDPSCYYQTFPNVPSEQAPPGLPDTPPPAEICTAADPLLFLPFCSFYNLYLSADPSGAPNSYASLGFGSSREESLAHPYDNNLISFLIAKKSYASDVTLSFVVDVLPPLPERATEVVVFRIYTQFFSCTFGESKFELIPNSKVLLSQDPNNSDIYYANFSNLKIDIPALSKIALTFFVETDGSEEQFYLNGIASAGVIIREVAGE